MVTKLFPFIIFTLAIVLFNLFNAIYFESLKSGFYQKAFAQIPTKGPMIPPPPSKTVGPGQPSSANQIPQLSSPKSEAMSKQDFANAYPEDITNENFPDLVESFDFKNANIRVVTEAISKLTGRNFIIDSAVNGTISIIAPSRITVAEAYKAFLSALAINNLTVVPAGKFLKVTTLIKAKGSSEVFSGAYTPDTDQMITRIIQLKHSNVAQVSQFINKAVSPQGNLQSYEPTNTLVITDFGSKINNFMKIIRQIDESSVNEQMAVIPIRFAKARDIAELLEKIINKGQPAPRGGRPNVPRFRRQQKSADKKKGSAFSLVLPDERTNSIIVLANQQGIAEVRRLIRQLDFDINPEDAGGLHVYYVKHAKAEDIANTINGIAQQSKKNTKGRPTIPSKTNIPSRVSPGATGFLGEEVKVTSDEQTNSLIIAASRQDYEIVLNLLSKIDIPRDQVFVEAIILEMSVSDTLTYGFNILGFQKGTDGRGRVGFSDPATLQTLFNLPASAGLVAGFGFGDSVSINPSPNPLATGDASKIEVKSIMGFVNFLKTVSKVNVLSTPQILALDNAEAEIEVGERVSIGPTNQLSAPGNPILSNPTYEDATMKLAITPQISSDKETVRLNIDQQIKEVIRGDPPEFTTRALKSDVVVQNGDTIVLGGLMRDSEAPIVHKIPILGDIPILGWLFKRRTRIIEKLNLLIFLTPRIIQDRTDARALSDLKLKERLQFIKDTGGEDFHGRKIEEIRIANADGNAATEDLSEEGIEDLQESLPETETNEATDDTIEEGIEDLEDIEL